MCAAFLNRPNCPIRTTGGSNGPRMHYAYFVPRNTTKLTTRGGTSPDGVKMTLIRERKSTHRLGTRLIDSMIGITGELQFMVGQGQVSAKSRPSVLFN